MPPTNPENDTMDLDLPANTNTPKPKPTTTTTTLTLKKPPFAYAHLIPLTPPASSSSPAAPLDTLQIRSYLTTALRQFLGDTGAAIPIDILHLQQSSVWVRVPRADLGAFAAGVTAFAGVAGQGGPGGGRVVLRVRACGDWLGGLVGSEEEGELWD